MPSIVSAQCTKLGKHVRKEGCLNCRHCRDLRALKGICSLTGVLQRCYSSINFSLECREKETLKIQHAQDGKAFTKKTPAMLQPKGMKFKLEAIVQVY